MERNAPQTEGVNPRSVGIDGFSTSDLVATVLEENRFAVDVTLSARSAIARAVDEIAARLEAGGRLHYVGAGTSGRIAYLDASEIPPTFGVPPEIVCAHIAGGPIALTQAVEGAEDDAEAGIREMGMNEHVLPGDAVIGISASGTASYVIGAIRKASELGAFTVALCNVENSALENAAKAAIIAPTGAEILAGSTRLKAGTAQKLVLNALSTAVMVRLGKTYDNLMVNVRATNDKLGERALRLVMSIAGCDETHARTLLTRAGGSVKIAIVMQRHGIDVEAATEMLRRCGGRLRACM